MVDILVVMGVSDENLFDKRSIEYDMTIVEFDMAKSKFYMISINNNETNRHVEFGARVLNGIRRNVSVIASISLKEQV